MASQAIAIAMATEGWVLGLGTVNDLSVLHSCPHDSGGTRYSSSRKSFAEPG